MALTDDSTTSSTNSGGLASTLTALNSASSNMWVLSPCDWRGCLLFAVIAGAFRLHGWDNGASLLRWRWHAFAVCCAYDCIIILFAFIFVANCSHIPPNEIVEKMPGIKAEGAKLSAAFNPVSPREPEIILLMRKTKSSTARTSDRPQSFSGLVKKSHFTWNVYLLSSRRGSSTIWVSFISTMLF